MGLVAVVVGQRCLLVVYRCGVLCMGAVVDVDRVVIFPVVRLGLGEMELMAVLLGVGFPWMNNVGRLMRIPWLSMIGVLSVAVAMIFSVACFRLGWSVVFCKMVGSFALVVV